MARIRSLRASQLMHSCSAELPFRTTDELKPIKGLVGQSQATEALQFGVDIHSEGYNLFVLGPADYGRHSGVKDYLDTLAKKKPVPPDLCYVNHFKDTYKPCLLRLPAGMGHRLVEAMDRLVEEIFATACLLLLRMISIGCAARELNTKSPSSRTRRWKRSSSELKSVILI